MKISINLIVALIAILLLSACNKEQAGDIEQSEDNRITEFKGRNKFMESERIAFLTQQLELTPDEAKVFWPIFNQYLEVKNSLWEQHRKLLQKTRQYQNLTDQIAKETLDSLILTQEEMLKNEKQLSFELLKLLSPQKVLKIQHAEHGFKRHLLKQIRGERQRRNR